MLEKEREQLRTELALLKSCQIRYFELAIIAAGAVLAVAGQLGDKVKPVVYLAPLLVVLPCWWVFFDKATTITRIVGYSRILEGMLRRSNQTSFADIGWENALAVFRLAQQPRSFKRKWEDFFRGVWLGIRHGLTFNPTQRYWIVTWYTFMLLGTACLGVAFRSGLPANSLEAWVTGIALLLSVIHNLSVLGHLLCGDYSYQRVEEIWRGVLRSPAAHQYLGDMFR